MSKSKVREGILDHIERVKALLDMCAEELIKRGEEHDKSKLVEPELSLYEVLKPKLEGLDNQSDEYRNILSSMGAALEHHYESNPHHPQYYFYWSCGACFKEPIEPGWGICPHCGYSVFKQYHHFDGMNLFDALEFLMDCKVASEDNPLGSIERSIEWSLKTFRMSEQTAKMLMNTASFLGWIEEKES